MDSGAVVARPHTDSELILGSEDASLLDIVDNVLNKGVVLSGDITIALAQVDLIYAQLSVLLCAADRVLPDEASELTERHSRRHARRSRSSTSYEADRSLIRRSSPRRRA